MLPCMRIDIEMDSDVDFLTGVESYLDSTVRPAIAAGLTAAALAVQEELTAALIASIDDPTPFTQRAIAILPANYRAGREPDAIVYVQERQAEYLRLQIDGGVRRAGDYATTRTGALVPGPHAPVDAYGNLPRGFVDQALADPHVGWTTMRKGAGYTALVRNVPGSKPQLLAFIMPTIEYEVSFEFYDIAMRSGEKHVPAEVSKAIDAAVRRAGADD